MEFFIQQSVHLLVLLSETLGSLGWGIVAFTFLMKTVLFPLTVSSIKTQKKLQDLQPELKKLSVKHGNDKKALQQAQIELYQRYNANPLAGCIPQLLQFFVLIVLYQALLKFIDGGVSNGMNLQFFWMNLGTPDKTYVLPLLAGLTQLVLSLMIAPGAEVRDVVPNSSKKKQIQEANKKEENMADMAATMQQQMLFIMPVMMGVLALNFPSGLVLYWVLTTVFSIGQQYLVSGWGGLQTYYQRLVQKNAKN